jgi:prefoldin subunit 4
MRFAQKELELLDDASTELMCGTSENDHDDGNTTNNNVVMLLLGEAFFETPEDDATEFCEAEVERRQTAVDELQQEQSAIESEQADLKKILYGRFGKSINLEES